MSLKKPMKSNDRYNELLKQKQDIERILSIGTSHKVSEREKLRVELIVITAEIMKIEENELNEKKSSWNKERIVFVSSLIVLGILFGLSLHFDNISGIEEDLGMTIHFLANVTSIESAKIELDFTKNQLKFESNFFVEDPSIMLRTYAKGFENKKCSEILILLFSNGKEQSITWHNDMPVPLSNFGDVEHITMERYCVFDKDYVPNGEFTFRVYGENETTMVPIKEIQFETSFNSKQYDCENSCIVARDFSYSDDPDAEKNIKTVTLDAKEQNKRSYVFDMRTIDTNYEYLSSLFFSLFLVGIGVTVAIITYMFSSGNQKKIGELLHFLSHKQKEVSTLTQQIKNVIARQEERDEWRRSSAQVTFDIYLEALKEQLKSFKEKFSDYQDNSDHKINKKQLDKIWKEPEGDFHYYTEILVDTVQTMSDVLDSITSQQIMEICRKINRPHLLPVKEFHVFFCESRIADIENLQKYYSNIKKNKEIFENKNSKKPPL